jgi:hypothetical protein
MIFIDNKYTRWYYNIVNTAKSRIPAGYTEKHHIIPKSFYINKSKTGWLEGNSEVLENKAKLTPEEHFLCHLLLVRMTTGLAKTKMSFALARLSRSKKLQGKINSRTYGYIKKLHSEAASITQKGVKEKHTVSKETREKISKSLLGRKLTDETKSKMKKPKSEKHRSNMKGRIIKEETRQKLSISATGRKTSIETRIKQSMSAKTRLPASAETKKKLSTAKKGRSYSDEHKRNLSLMQKNLPRLCCLHCGYEVDSRTFNRFHNSLCNKNSRI